MIKLLYVEDEPFLGKIVKESLESRQFEVCMVADGAQVMQALHDFQPNICVLDVMLPNRDGFSLGAEIRAKNPELPIVFVTAKTQTEDVVKGFSSGGNDFLRKPFSMEELIVRLHNLLALARGKGSASSDVVPIGKYTFFPLKYELHLGESSRKLSAREADLLKILLENRNFTVARKDILLKVWGDDHFFNSRNLDVYITKLRDYFKEDPEIRIITIKGVGYHFTA
jgi:two-component system, OmpR family, response regulator VicR